MERLILTQGFEQRTHCKASTSCHRQSLPWPVYKSNLRMTIFALSYKEYLYWQIFLKGGQCEGNVYFWETPS